MKNFRGNWEQNDPTADDYIKNRPFYSDDQEKPIFENLTSEDYDNGNYPPCNFILGNVYTVIWNNQRYENITCIEESGYNTIKFDDVFCIDDDGGDGLYISSYTDESYVVSLCSAEEIIHKLDEKFIPDTIARVTEIEEVLETKLDVSELNTVKQEIITELKAYIDQAILGGEW
jgi:hypothetical protein